jgi:hypothetical protein
MVLFCIALVAVSNIVTTANRIVKLVVALVGRIDPVGIYTYCELRPAVESNKKQNEYGDDPGIQVRFYILVKPR